ncbi:MAG: hypothetical protein AAF708_03695 [Deinococcota bacterium]
MQATDKITFIQALESSWSLASSTKWTQANPASGQCGVTALVAQDVLGGDILKTKYGDIWHFYNRIEGEVIDFTKSQFEASICYDHHTATRAEAFADTNAEQYEYLSTTVQQHLGNTP